MDDPQPTLSSYATADGSPSLYHHQFGEAFHHSAGALMETEQKFLQPAQLQAFKDAGHHELAFLDVCMGLGYETIATYQQLQSLGLRCLAHAIDISPAPLRHALTNQCFRNLWSQKAVCLLEKLATKGYWQEPFGEGRAIWQDARTATSGLTNSYHLIYLDAFSPKVCPELWTIDFLARLVDLLYDGGRLVTYCRSAAVRKALLDCGCDIYSLPGPPDSSTWSLGTVAIKPDSDGHALWWADQQPFCELSDMEQEHLHTKSAIPYRDPDLTATKSHIIRTRATEQAASPLPSAKHLRLKWTR